MKSPGVLVGAGVCRHLDEASGTCTDAVETGGILIGCYRGGNIEVTGRTLPGPSDVRRPFTFVRMDGAHQAAASGAWSRSGGTHTWVGEWHTHPSGGVVPSAIDLRSWSRLVKGTRLPMIFALAVPGGWGLFLTRPSWVRRKTVRLMLCERGSMGLVFRERESGHDPA